MSTKKMVRWLILLMVISLSMVGVAAAAPLAPPAADTFVNINDAAGVSHGADAQLWATISGDPDGNCVSTRTTYLKFSLASVAPGANVAPTSQLVLTRSGATSNPGYTVGLYKTTNAWVESSDNTGVPPVGTALGSPVAFPASNGAQVIFTGQALADYVKASNVAPDDAVSFAVRLVSAGACGSGATSLVFSSKEGASSPALTVDITTAITLSTLRSVDPAPNWPLIAGLGALVALAAGGVLFYRKRATTH